MCTVLLAHGWRPDQPVVLAANRDELVGRPTEAPLRLAERPPLFGGRDLVASGTWLAVDPDAHRSCAVTNRHLRESAPGRDPTLRSRGELPLRVLSAADPLGELAALEPRQYNPVNVVYVSADEAWAVSLDKDGGHRASRLAPGVHALTVQDMDDPRSPKTQRLLAWATAAAAEAADATALVERFTAILASHDTIDGDPASAACIHGDEYGTVSSSTVLLGMGRVSFRYAGGRPCVTAYDEVDLLALGGRPPRD